MVIMETLAHLDALIISAVLLAAVLLVHVVPFLTDRHGIRANNVPGPLWARFTDAWMGLVALRGHRSETVHELHQKHGESAILMFGYASTIIGTCIDRSTCSLHVNTGLAGMRG